MKFKLIFLSLLFLASHQLIAQEQLYPDRFPLQDIRLKDGIYKDAMDLNIQNLLKYDTDRLLVSFLKAANLPTTKPVFPNWEDLDGHILGHYLSSMAIHYAASGNTDCKDRMDYIVSELKRCQTAFGNGYVGAITGGLTMWDQIKAGNINASAFGLNDKWVPWYNIHKTFAGLRDAWAYGRNEDAKQMFLDLCDWGLTIINPLSESQMETMLVAEYGGMNEVYADAYAITGDVKYLNAAKKFSHKVLFDRMSARVDNLDNMHANTQIPKAIGYARVADLSNEAAYNTAAKFFWETVTTNRSLALGGNGRDEHFPSASACRDYTETRNGPESCNTNNMLKLSGNLFSMDPDAKYADFYERAMMNHILSTQHPEHGGYVYFTSARPQHYRVYSAPNSAMWCCVGTGMENHGKYSEFIYTHSGDSLYLNLFVASELNWKEKGIAIEQETLFPDADSSKLIIKTDTPQEFTLMVRYPGWVKPGEMSVVCNGVNYAASASPASYVAIKRTWNNNDVVEIKTPMHVSIEEMPNVPEYIAVMYGPVLLGARTGTEHLAGLIADDGRWAHVANGPMIPLTEAPIIVGEREEILQKLNNMQPVPGKTLQFTVPELFISEKNKDLVFEPFFRIHDSRYMMYWLSMTEREYLRVKDDMDRTEHEKMTLDNRTVDMVSPGEQQPEVDHQLQSHESYTGYHMEEGWRDARSGGFFSYNLLTEGKEELFLMVRYWGNEGGNRTFDILIDGEVLVTENVTGKWNKNEFVDVEYPIPARMLTGKSSITVRFQPKANNVAGGVFGLRLLTKKKVDTFELSLLIRNIENKLQNIDAGSGVGEYPADIVSNFEATLNASKALMEDEEATEEDVSNEVASLKEAYRNFLAEKTGPPLIHFQAAENNQIIDLTGNNFNIELKNGASTQQMGTYRVINLGAANGYVDMSAEAGNALAQMDDFSVSVYYHIKSTTFITGAGNFLWTFSTRENCDETNGEYIAYRVNSQRYALSEGGWRNESEALQIGLPATKGKWQHMLYTQMGNVAQIYINGELKAEGKVYYTPSEIGATTYNWLGRSPFGSDVYLRNTLLYDFKMMNRTLKISEIEELAGEVSRLQYAHDNPAAGTSNPLIGSTKAWTENKKIMIQKTRALETCRVYNVLGVLLFSVDLTDETTEIKAQPGIYIVRTSAGFTQKLIVK